MGYLRFTNHATALASEKMYMNLIKLHLKNDPRHTRSLHWNTTDLAVVIVHHEKFLCGVARTGHPGIHVDVFAKCLTRHFESRCNCAFARKMADALAFCRANGKPSRTSKAKRLLHGKITPKTASAVKSVISAINESILASSIEACEALEDADDAPPMRSQLAPGDMVGDAAAALQRLQEAFGESQGSATACSSTSPHA